jgi:hypothetical protein
MPEICIAPLAVIFQEVVHAKESWDNKLLRGETPLEHSLEQRSPFFQRILYPVSNLLLNSLHLFLLFVLIEKFQIEESLLVYISE